MWRILLLCILLVAAGRAGAARVGEIEVRQAGNGMPCFTVAASEEKNHGAPNFHSIAVTEVAGNTTMWKMVMPRERTFAVLNYMCVPYAGRPPVLPQTPAAPLRSGKTYEVVITAEPATALSPRQYRGRFCLLEKDGALQVQSATAPRSTCPRD